MIKIVVDSTCNLDPGLIKKLDLRVAPISIQFGNDTYEEGISIDRDTFYRKIEEMGIIPTTSQPTPAAYADYYRELSAAGHTILVITITSKHSGTYDSAVLAKSMVPEADVHIFDSLSISLGTGFMILEAAAMCEAGKQIPEIIERLEAIREKMFFALTPATLKYLQMSGRVGRLQGALGSLLSVKPIIALKEGTLEAGESIRTRSKSIERLLGMMEEALGSEQPIKLAVIHARAPEDAEDVVQQAEARFNCQETLVGDLVASLAVHGGPGILALAAYPA